MNWAIQMGYQTAMSLATRLATRTAKCSEIQRVMQMAYPHSAMRSGCSTVNRMDCLKDCQTVIQKDCQTVIRSEKYLAIQTANRMDCQTGCLMVHQPS